MSLSKEQILAANDRPLVKVRVPEWANGTGDDAVFVRGLTVKQLLKMRHAWKDRPEDEYGLLMCCWCIVDEHGERIFSEADIEALSEKSYAPVDRIMDVARELNGMTPKAAEETEKNS